MVPPLLSVVVNGSVFIDRFIKILSILYNFGSPFECLENMTILPTIRKTNASTEESKDGNQQSVSADRSNRRNEINSLQISSLADNNSSARRSPFPFKTDRKDRLRKRFKEPDRARDREREREQKRDARREQKRDRLALTKREIGNEPLIVDGSDIDVKTVPETSCNNSKVETKEESTGFNSEDEYDESSIKDRLLTEEEWQKRDEFFSRCMSSLGYEIKQINEDGACLFRSIADQVYGDQEFHYQVRQDCMNYIVQNRDYFEPYVTEDFDKYVARKRTWHVHGNHLEIQAMSELYNRTIEVYCYQIEPINIFNCSTRIVNTYEPIRLSYHRMCHYNSISNPNKPSVGVGLGLPNYHPIDIDHRRLHDAVRASEQLLIEQTMLEDKLKATDWEATNEAIEEQVARESYIQYFRDTEKRLKAQGHPLASGSSSTITSSMASSPRSSRRGSVSPKGCQSPKSCSSPKNNYSSLPSPRATAFLANTVSDNNIENVPPAYVPTKEEEAFAKRVYNSPRRITDQSEMGFNIENFTGEFTQQAGPSSVANNIGGLEDFDQGIMAQVLAESQQTYLDELKSKSRKRNVSPGPSTST
ncbi:OTU domain-containing protein 5 isoform X2 [Cylas formicarius]|uniref:OTU domain-containing protein 5 isoform X2 n=1 Tax=Cylas formicarius TaxID=197179 RepID=UPI002958B5E8|nr:OTU domain-containing protein 5 isoform X2 [Cylas formicarius]